MNLPITASAPGKVVLSGEYAVLDGAPAVCMAVNRRARVTMKAIDNDHSSVIGPGYSNRSGRFRVAEGELSWIDRGESYAILDAAWQVSDKRPGREIDLELNSSAFMDEITGQKLGIGSSAAVTVALCAVLNSEQRVARAAYSAHEALHDTSGSGVDVACSLHGGLIEYHRGEKQVVELRWPPALQFRLVWTGVAVSTAAKLSILNSSTKRSSRAELGYAAKSLAASWQGSDAQVIVEEYADYMDRLQRFSGEHKLGIFDAGHAKLMNTAQSLGVLYKPCGAGGGDIGIVLGTDEGKLDAFIRSLPNQFAVIDCELDSSGFRIEASQ